MWNSLKAPSKSDNGGTRCGSNRRQLTEKGFFPERRLGIERRNVIDRRKGHRPRDGNAIERREIFRKSIDIG